MNWLAHVFLSENDIDFQLGNVLADPLKGKVWQGANARVEAGFAMHREIDRFTDANECVVACKKLLGDSGRLRGVVVDVCFDYLLCKNWARYSKIKLDEFLLQFNLLAREKVQTYPKPAQAFIERMLNANLLNSYTTLSGIEAALYRTDRRLSTSTLKRESTAQYFPGIERYEDKLDANFKIFFPQLIEFFKARTSISFEDHWLIDYPDSSGSI